MSDLIFSATAFGIVLVLSFAALKAWRSWLELRRLELEGRRPSDQGSKEIELRIQLADVRERLKKLEAIADGVEL